MDNNISTDFFFDKIRNHRLQEKKQDRLDSEENKLTDSCENSQQVFNYLVQLLDEKGFNYDVKLDNLQLHFNCQGKNGKWRSFGGCLKESEQFYFYSVFLETTNDKNHLAIAELLTRINYGLILGNFELNWETGIMRYKTSIDISITNVSRAIIRKSIEYNFTVMDYYYPAIMSVYYQVARPSEAIMSLLQEDLPEQ